MSDPDLVAYYRERAEDYDTVYDKPERQANIRALGSRLQELVAGRRVLELAAGTGFWTVALAAAADVVVATDVNEETLQVARRRNYSRGNVSFVRADAFAPDRVAGQFDMLVAGFFLSHVARDRVPTFLAGVAARVSGGRVVLFDSNYVEGSNLPLTRRAENGDTYQRRRLSSGREFEVRKNFYTAGELRRLVEPYGDGVIVEDFTYYWLVVADVA